MNDYADCGAGRHSALTLALSQRERGLVPALACFLASSVMLVIAGCGGPAPTAATRPPVVYVCTETQEAFVGTARRTPAANPDTGRDTLVPALYNPEAGRWQAMPPLDVLDGNPGGVVSKNSDRRLTPDGPTDGLRRLADG
jgi:hypothetical protein